MVTDVSDVTVTINERTTLVYLFLNDQYTLRICHWLAPLKRMSTTCTAPAVRSESSYFQSVFCLFPSRQCYNYYSKTEANKAALFSTQPILTMFNCLNKTIDLLLLFNQNKINIFKKGLENATIAENLIKANLINVGLKAMWSSNVAAAEN